MVPGPWHGAAALSSCLVGTAHTNKHESARQIVGSVQSLEPASTAPSGAIDGKRHLKPITYPTSSPLIFTAIAFLCSLSAHSPQWGLVRDGLEGAYDHLPRLIGE